MRCEDCGRPKLLDTFCAAGGASRGFAQAGFCVDGVDINPQPHYPYRFFQGNAIEFVKERGHEYAALAGSPPCQRWSTLRSQTTFTADKEDLIDATRLVFEASGLPWVIENVVGAPLLNPTTLCGSMFGLGALCRDGEVRYLKRHRKFETSFPLQAPSRCHHVGQPVGVYGAGGGGQQTRGYKGFVNECRDAMGIDWMNQKELSLAIPPAYSHYVGTFLMEAVLI